MGCQASSPILSTQIRRSQQILPINAIDSQPIKSEIQNLAVSILPTITLFNTGLRQNHSPALSRPEVSCSEIKGYPAASRFDSVSPRLNDPLRGDNLNAIPQDDKKNQKPKIRVFKVVKATKNPLKSPESKQSMTYEFTYTPKKFSPGSSIKPSIPSRKNPAKNETSGRNLSLQRSNTSQHIFDQIQIDQSMNNHGSSNQVTHVKLAQNREESPGMSPVGSPIGIHTRPVSDRKEQRNLSQLLYQNDSLSSAVVIGEDSLVQMPFRQRQISHDIRKNIKIKPPSQETILENVSPKPFNIRRKVVLDTQLNSSINGTRFGSKREYLSHLNLFRINGSGTSSFINLLPGSRMTDKQSVKETSEHESGYARRRTFSIKDSTVIPRNLLSQGDETTNVNHHHQGNHNRRNSTTIQKVLDNSKNNASSAAIFRPEEIHDSTLAKFEPSALKNLEESKEKDVSSIQ